MRKHHWRHGASRCVKLFSSTKLIWNGIQLWGKKAGSSHLSTDYPLVELGFALTQFPSICSSITLVTLLAHLSLNHIKYTYIHWGFNNTIIMIWTHFNWNLLIFVTNISLTNQPWRLSSQPWLSQMMKPISWIKTVNTPAVFVIRLPVTARTYVRSARQALEKKVALMQVILTRYLSNWCKIQRQIWDQNWSKSCLNA